MPRDGQESDDLPGLPRRGRGRTKRSRFEVRIKAGTRDGQRIRIPGKGNAGAHGGAGGRSLRDHPDRGASCFSPRRRRHLPDRAGQRHRSGAGSKDRSADHRWAGAVKIPPGTQSGQKLRLREKGVPSATKDGVRGDEIVEITVTVPMPRDERTKELLRELAKLNPEDPRAKLWKEV